MTNAIEVFRHEKFGNVRIVDRDGRPWFVAKDVAKALGYSNIRDAILKHCKGGRVLRLPSGGGEQEAKIIPEADLFRLIMRSKLPDAEVFQDWVVEVVLPAIRERGEYVPSRPREIPVDTDALIAMVKRLELAEDRVDAFRPRSAYGTISEITGEPRTSLVPAFFRSLRRRVIREMDEFQMRLFDIQ